MSSPHTADSRPPSRRERRRLDTLEEIKTLARRQLAELGPGGVSLRAIAREMGTASSALYRYFGSYEDLISALCVDAYTAVADSVAAAVDDQAADDHAERWRAVCRAYRRWSLDNPASFALIFGTPVPGYQAPDEVTGPAATRLLGIPLEVFAASVRAGAADLDRTQVPPTLELGSLARNLLADTGADIPPRLTLVVLNAWASLLGYLTAEIFGSLPRLVGDTDQLYQAHVRTVMLGAGYRPALVDAIDVERPPAGPRGARQRDHHRPATAVVSHPDRP
jgi:AcrR family transcriptional regulator